MTPVDRSLLQNAVLAYRNGCQWGVVLDGTRWVVYVEHGDARCDFAVCAEKGDAQTIAAALNALPELMPDDRLCYGNAPDTFSPPPIRNSPG